MMTTATFQIKDLGLNMTKLLSQNAWEGSTETMTLRWELCRKVMVWSAWFTDSPDGAIRVAYNAPSAQSAIDRLKLMFERGSGR